MSLRIFSSRCYLWDEACFLWASFPILLSQRFPYYKSNGCLQHTCLKWHLRTFSSQLQPFLCHWFHFMTPPVNHLITNLHQVKWSIKYTLTQVYVMQAFIIYSAAHPMTINMFLLCMNVWSLNKNDLYWWTFKAILLSSNIKVKRFFYQWMI